LSIYADMTESIMNIQIIELGVWVPLTDSGSQVVRRGGDVKKGQVKGYVDLVFLVRGCICRETLNREVGFESWDEYLFGVCSWEDEEVLRGGGCG